MATFVEVTPDAFNSTFRDKALEKRTRSATEQNKAFPHVRRPVRGLVIKEDTYATIQVVTADGRNIKLIDAAARPSPSDNQDGFVGGRTDSYSNFLIQNISEQRAEKQQLVVTFGEPYIFFFGEQPRFIQVQGVLLNSADFNWRAEFWENYERYLRGTRCVQNKARVYLSWDDIVVEGYITDAQAQEQAQERNWLTFGFNLFITNYQNISNVGDPDPFSQSYDAQLDPSEIDTLSSGTAGFQSSALAVRVANVQAAANQKSLLASLRDGQVLTAISQGTSRLVELQGQVQDMLNKAGDFLGGRDVRVPVGFGGSSVYDEEVQLNLASIDPANINGNQARITANVGGKEFTIRLAVGASAITPTITGPLYLNTDEFVAGADVENVPPAPLDLFAAQRGDDFVAQSVVRDTFKAFGIDTEPPSEVVRLIGKVTFGVVNYVGGKALGSIQSQAARQAINVVPGIITG